MQLHIFSSFPQSSRGSSYITRWATLKMLREVNCVATRLSKVAASRWLAGAPTPAALYPACLKIAARERWGAGDDAGIGQIAVFGTSPSPAAVICQRGDRCHTEGRSPCLRIKNREGNHTRTHSDTHFTSTQGDTITLCILRMLVEYREWRLNN